MSQIEQTAQDSECILQGGQKSKHRVRVYSIHRRLGGIVRDTFSIAYPEARIVMGYDKRNISTPPHNLASLVRGLYGRVARHLDIDPSYVSRVARGERQSEAIEAALEREMRQIMKMVKANHNGSGRRTASRRGAGRRNSNKARTAK